MGQDNRISDSANGSSAAGQKRGPRPLVVLIVLLIVACVAAGVAGGMYLVNTYTQIKDVENSQDIVPTLPSSSSGSAAASSDKQEGTIDFKALQQTNSDIYAWIYIPDTNVNYPVCQNATDNAYYLTHGPTGNESDIGAIFSEAQFNHKDFQDPVTVLYGHNGYGSTMFSDLHGYERQDYFDTHENVYVYTPDKVYTYRVFSAFMAGSKHIMGTFDFASDAGISEFITFLKDPGAIDAHVSDVQVDVDDKLIVLATCNTGALEATGRYLVCGVLVDEQPAA